MFFERNREELNNILNETRALLSVGDINAAQNYLVQLSGSDSFNKWKHLVFENEYKRYISREPCLTNEQLLEESGYYQKHNRDESTESDQISADDFNHIFNDNTEAQPAENTVLYKTESVEENNSESQWEENSHKHKLQADVDELARRRNHLQSDGKPETPKHDEIYWTSLVAVLLGIGGFFFWPLFIVTAVLFFYRYGATEDNAYKLETEALEEHEKDLADTKRTLESAIAACDQFQKQVSRQERFERYKQIRKEIEAMPRYKIWRDEVLQRFGNTCVIGGDCAGQIEVDHYPVSMYQLVKKSGLLEISDAEERRMRAYEFTPFWSINNGAPLCKKHHDKTTSSKRYYSLKQERGI